MFIDESGDPGFKLDRGSSPNFALAMVLFQSPEDAQHAQRTIKAVRSAERVSPEWKFSKVKDAKRDAFFQAVSGCKFTCRAVVVQKHLIHSRNLKTKPRQFYNFFTRMMFQHDGGMLKGAAVVIDGSGDRRFRKELQSYLRRELPPGTIRKMGFKDSLKDPLVQLADMCAGAIARSYSNKPNATRWRNMLARSGQVHDVWEFR
ncbi:DUF3800 domain-containing protein [Ruegeria sp. 2012CJ41-6]|uniref:DUF3800 domain-containing protein n=1 Tax=Ruegeria spongiae TaxID=2942209 RepID=A0ABT0Q695_9RHOB|nr:DUF3800 domain-containing protein [Ruegeria spongiae]MCL6285411.1 DUF3800 domain-containing protein [Ruegeria spongiae]